MLAFKRYTMKQLSDMEESIQKSFGPFRLVLSEGDEPIAWGHSIERRLGVEVWDDLKNQGFKFSVVARHGSYCVWALITKELSKEEAENKYGPVTSHLFGSGKGFKSITFGSQTFKHQQFRNMK